MTKCSLPHAPMNNSVRAPVVIGGLGGSGTRVVARIVRRAGFFLGTNLTGAEDAVEFWEFYDRWINRYLLRGDVLMSADERQSMEREWRACAARHRRTIPAQSSPWGWKNPRAVLLLSFLHEQYPGMKFIHVVRDGRDMAFSPTAQEQVRQHGGAVLGDEMKDAPMPVFTSACWAKINLDAACYGELRMTGQYYAVIFEKLCAEPQKVIEGISIFLGMGTTDALQMADEPIVQPPSLGRWKNCADGNLMEAIQFHAQDALRKFGYC